MKPIPIPGSVLHAGISLALVVCAPAHAADFVFKRLDAADLKATAIAFRGSVTAAWDVRDRAGRHILLLTRDVGPSREQPDPDRNERTDLRASYWRSQDGKWVESWHIKDGVDCPGLDGHASFFDRHVTATDLDKDGIAEITVPYKMFCGGGIDPDTVKVILRQGAQKFALRGEALVVIPGEASFGGEVKADRDLYLDRNARYRLHLEQVWQRVYKRVYPVKD